MKKRQTKKHLAVVANAGEGNMSRAAFAKMAGFQFGGDRDLYQVLGYPAKLDSRNMYAMYKRGDMAKTIVNAYPDACFRNDPEVFDDESENETAFEKAVIELNETHHIWNYCQRADRLCGIGRFSLLVLGVNDGQPLDKPLVRAKELLWLMPVPEYHVQISTWTSDPLSANFGKPELYSITTGVENSTNATSTRVVHYTRVLHIAQDCEQDDVYGTPTLEAVFNRLMDKDKLAGGSAETYWLNARNGLQFKADAGMVISDVAKLKEEAEEYQHQLRRILTAKNGAWEAMGATVADPTGSFAVNVDIIAATTRIPKRILMGNEAGELGSSQDETNWIARVDERRRLHVVPFIIRKLINKLIECGILSKPRGDKYQVEFPPAPMSAVDESTIMANKANAIATYSNSSAAQMIVPPQEFREEVLGLPPESPFELPDEIDDGDLDPGTEEGSDANPDDPEALGSGDTTPVPPVKKADPASAE